jgi:CRISPR-associated protein Cmr5
VNETNVHQTLEQRRAVFAWDRVNSLEKNLNEKAGMYIRKLPAMTFNNGLGQTLAFLLAKAAEDVSAHSVYDILADWLITERQIYTGGKEQLIKTIAENDRYQYQLAQEEVWALLNWLKKFTDAFLPKENSTRQQVKGSENDGSVI